MATKKTTTTAAKKTTSKTKAITKDVIVSAYMEYVLMEEKTPKSVYKFAKEHAMTEADFYKLNRHEHYETELKTSNYQRIVTSLKNSELKTSSSRNNLKSTIILVASL